MNSLKLYVYILARKTHVEMVFKYKFWINWCETTKRVCVVYLWFYVVKTFIIICLMTTNLVGNAGGYFFIILSYFVGRMVDKHTLVPLSKVYTSTVVVEFLFQRQIRYELNNVIICNFWNIYFTNINEWMT